MRHLSAVFVLIAAVSAQADPGDIIIDRLRSGDSVMTSGGSIGTINGIFSDRDISIRIGNSNYTVSRENIAGTGCNDNACNGTQAYTSGGSVAKVFGVFPSGEMAVQIGNSGYKVSRENLAIDGCVERICSGDAVTTRGGSNATVNGVFQSGEVSIRIGNSNYKVNAADLASERRPRERDRRPRRDSIDRVVVSGETVYTSGGSTGVVVGIFGSGEISVRIGSSNYTIHRRELAVEGCYARLCSKDSVVTRGGSNATVVGFFIDSQVSVRIGSSLYKVQYDDLAPARW